MAVCALIALAGLALLTLDFSSLRFNPGDAMMVVSALSFAGNLMVLERHSDALRPQDVMGRVLPLVPGAGRSVGAFPFAGRAK